MIRDNKDKTIDNSSYDYVVIGGGFGGLICACYLAKAGRNVLLVEKNRNPGGYCCSFKRKGVTIDAVAHAFGALRKNGGVFRAILEDLDLDEEIKFNTHDPSTIIISSDFKIELSNNYQKPLASFSDAFPSETDAIRIVLDKIENMSGIRSIIDYRDMSFVDFIKSCGVKNPKLVATFMFPVFAHRCMPPSKITELTGIMIYKQLLMDSYYPEDGGAQVVPDRLLHKFCALGGEARLKTSVTRIISEDKIAKAVVLGTGETVYADNIISNIDMMSTINMYDESEFKADAVKTLLKLTPSGSAYMLYLITEGILDKKNLAPSILWMGDNFDINKYYQKIIAMDFSYLDAFEIFLPTMYNKNICQPGKDTLTILSLTQFMTKGFWDNHRVEIANKLIDRVNRWLFPGLKEKIVYQENATPHTLSNFTNNYQGAAYGWAESSSPFHLKSTIRSIRLKNLYMVGAWVDDAGLAGVAHAAKKMSMHLLK